MSTIVVATVTDSKVPQTTAINLVVLVGYGHGHGGRNDNHNKMATVLAASQGFTRMAILL